MPSRPAPIDFRPLTRLFDGLRRWLSRGNRRTRWLKLGSLVVGVPFIGCLVLATIFWVSYGHMIDRRLVGEQRPIPRIFARPFELRPGQGLSPLQLEQRLNDVGYAERVRPDAPGQFSIAGNVIVFTPRPTTRQPPAPVRVEFSKSATSPVVAKLTAVGGGPIPRVLLEPPLLTAFAPGEKRRYTPLGSLPRWMIDAVVAIEDRRFFEHPGVDPIGAVGALITNLRGTKPYLVGGSTLTQQIVKNTFLTPAKTYARKLQEQFMALVLESRFTKNQILELYLNDVTLGQRGPFEIHGVAEAARIFFGKDVSNLTLPEAATIAGLIQSPSRLSPFRHPEQAQERRNVVLHEMATSGFITNDAAARATTEPLRIVPRALENEAPYFVDYVSQLVDEQYSGLLQKNAKVDVYTTLDLQLQRLAQEAIAAGIVQVDKQLAARKRKGPAEAALIAVDPRTGEILAFVGGRAYNQSQFNRVIAARRQPGSAFKPFVYLAAFEKMAAEGSSDITPATVVVDEPTTFLDGEGKDYTPANYQNDYGGPVTLRNALAHSRNIVAIKVAMATGYDQVAALWKKVGVGTEAKPYPSIALGVFEASPFEMATAYTLFTNGGSVRPLHAMVRIVDGGTSREVPAGALRQVARPETTFLVANMMRSVLNEGTAAGARGQGFALDAAGKTGTTNDLRDAWFIGFTPELLTAVWVGLDGNQPIGLSGSQAALPIWTDFMKKALSARPNKPFDVPPGVEFAQVDKLSGKLATPMCPTVISESFLAGTAPKEYCDLHGSNPAEAVRGLFSKLGGWFKRVIR
jgi:penicillin-binding protein 1B